MVLCGFWLAACEPEEPAIVFQLEGLERAASLHVQVKLYREDDESRIFDIEDIALDEEGRERGGDLSLLVNLPERGRYAVHFVARGVGGESFVDTRCHDVQGLMSDTGVVLTRLGSDLDADGDTFPDDIRTYCAARTAEGLSCDVECHEPEFMALVDCNPHPDLELGPGCTAAIPPNGQWNPFADDVCSDCFDQDCFGGDPPCGDRDEDGFLSDVDCDDRDPQVNPDAEEGCRNDDQLDCPGCGDGIDNDCDGTIDESCFGEDFDNDGVPFTEDCNDCDPGIHPGAEEVCGNNVDDDCSAAGDPSGDEECHGEDHDGDGYAALPIGDDCDDMDARIYPGAPERCGDGAIQSCDSDHECREDRDGDHFSPPFDCEDSDPGINPWATESCDPEGIDEDCDGLVNEVNDPTGQRGCARNAAEGVWVAIDFANDMDHCGICRHRCEGPTWRYGDRCLEGQCSCGSGESCDGTLETWCCPGSSGESPCVDLTSDVEHCGACDRACAPGEVCRPVEDEELGSCFCQDEGDGASCPLDPCIACCPGVGCVDVCENIERCGSCDIDCSAGSRPLGDRCVDGQCLCGEAEESCLGDTFCSNVVDPTGCGCLDLENDRTNCGACGNACDPGESCVDGSCACNGTSDDCDADMGEVCCSDLGCMNLSTDTESCGACGNPCQPGEICERGRCACSEDCEDGNSCTEARCDFGRCRQMTRDTDDDGFCDEDCPDSETGRIGDCRDGDCDDTRAEVNPFARETCDTRWDDDCDGEANEVGARDCTDYFRDEDGDSYGTGAPRCLCEADGDYVATRGGDCEDFDETVNPGADEVCNSDDDDCDAATLNGADECADRCCGSPPSCQECCSSGQCPGARNICSSFSCGCEPGWSSCEDDCDCNTGGDSVCCDGSCFEGNCCLADDCGPGQDCCFNECTTGGCG